MPFGLKNAPATFQRLVNSLFDGMADRVENYIDDIAVYSQTWEQHLQNLKKVVSLLQYAGLTLGTDKCTLGTVSCEFQGHVAGSGRVVPGKDKIEASREFARPQTKPDVRAWLGLTGYYHRFIQECCMNCSTIGCIGKQETRQYILE